MDMIRQVGAQVITVYIEGVGGTDEIEGRAVAFTGDALDDGTPICEIVTTEGAAFDAIGLYAGDTPDTYAVAIGGIVAAGQDGSIEDASYQLVGADGTGGIKAVTEGGRPVSVIHAIPAAHATIIKF